MKWLIGLSALIFGVALAWLNKASSKIVHNPSSVCLTSGNIKNGDQLPVDQTCVGRNISPHLAWSNVPTGAKSFSIICDDPDAPAGIWVHWVIFNIPPTVNELSAAIPVKGVLDNGARHGKNDFGNLGYGGACPPKGHGKHRYFFKLYALDVMLDLQPGATKTDVENAMEGHILATAQLQGWYERK